MPQHTITEHSLLDCSHREARALLATGAPAYLFVNPVEFHGPHLPLHNDRLVSQGLARDLHRRLCAREPSWPFLTAGDLEVGVEPTAGLGSRHTPFPLARDLVREACRALAELGASKVVLMTFHGAPLHNVAIEAGVEVLVARGVRALSPFNAVLRELLEVDGNRHAEAFAHVEDAAERGAMIRDLHLDFHGGFFETSMTLHYAPESVSADYTSVAPCPAITPNPAIRRAADVARAIGRHRLSRELELAAWGIGWQELAPFPGYTGRPHRATAATGAYFAREIVELYERLALEVFAGRARSPEPIMAWTAALTMQGRLSPRPARAVAPV